MNRGAWQQQPMESQRVGHDLVTNTYAHYIYIYIYIYIYTYNFIIIKSRVYVHIL